jgi:predicted amidophosphoribosyltransferase
MSRGARRCVSGTTGKDLGRSAHLTVRALLQPSDSLEAVPGWIEHVAESACGLSGACLAPRPPGPDVCGICCGALDGPSDVCRSCRQVERGLRRPLHPVTPISLTTSDTGLYAALKQYKGQPTSISRRQQLRLADLLGTFFERHGRCVAPDGYDAVVVVPSGQVRAEHHPLASTLCLLPEVGHAVVDALRRGRATIERNTPARDAYRCRRELVEERRVLLVDDTYTTGAHLQSAAAALEDARTREVRLLVVGRHQSWGWEPARQLLEWSTLAENRWSPQCCIRCRGVR